MIGRIALVSLALALAALAPAAPPKPAHPAAARDWSEVVTRLPSGAYLRGNPAAKAKLVEYFSLTCPHCAAFSAEAAAPLGALLKAGTVSLEFRHAVRDGVDLAGSLAARCAGQRGYFPVVAEMMAKQADWSAKLDAWETANGPKLEAMPQDAALTAVAEQSGLAAIAVAHGLPAGGVRACIANPAEQKLLAAMAQEAWGARKIPGTPSFLLNGALLPQTSSWDTLRPKLEAALK